MYPYGQLGDGERKRRAEPADDRATPRRETVDETVAHRVAERILDDPAILSGHLVIDVQNGVVILEGRMDCVEACAAASRQAWATAGVRDVSNRLTTSTAER